MKKQWITEGFEAFRRGIFGNGGQNLYVSRAGVLQRIYQYDLNHSGYFDLVFANCQNHHEAAPAYVYSDVFGKVRRSSLPAQGAVSGAVADLYGSGNADLIVCGRYDMAAPFSSSDIYFGGGEYSENRHIRIPTPWAESSAAGYFKGGKLPALAFSLPLYKVVRIFYPSELGVEWSRFIDLPLMTGQLETGDLDGDGYDELIVRKNDSVETVIYWGGPDGISPDCKTVMPELPEADRIIVKISASVQSQMEKEMKSPALPRIVVIDGRQYLTVITERRVLFYTISPKREIELGFELQVPEALAVAAGDLRNNGVTDLFIASRRKENDVQCSYLYLGGAEGFCERNRIMIPTNQASDAVMADLNGNGHADLVIAQSHTEYSYTNHLLVYPGTPEGIGKEPLKLEAEDAQRVFAVPQPDGTHDLLVINHYARSAVGFDKCYIYWGSGNGYSPENMQEVPGWCAVDSLSADLDDDGWAELVICNNSENSLHLDPGFHVHHFGPEGFEPEKTYLLPTKLGWGAVCGDFNRDGYLDIIAVAEHWSALKIFYGGPDGFRKSEVISLGNRSGARWIIAVDLNKNGYLDLVVPLINSDRTLILHGGPEGFSMERHSELAVYHGTCVRAADLSGNGYPDLIIGSHIETPQNGELTPHNPHQSFVHIYWNGPEGLRENNKTILRADAAVAMAIADFNNDGWLDIFAGNYHNGKERDINSILYWNRQGKFHELDRQLIFTHSASGCLAADFNEDGYVDLAVANHKVDGDHLGFSTVWWNGPEGFERRNSTDLPTAGPHGMTALEPGNQLDRGPEEYYTSEPFQLNEDVVLDEIKWEGEVPPKTWVTAKVRIAACPELLGSSPWLKPGRISIKSGEYIQYQLALGAVNSLRTPRITRVTMSFLCSKKADYRQKKKIGCLAHSEE